jgi:mxaJ protein
MRKSGTPPAPGEREKMSARCEQRSIVPRCNLDPSRAVSTRAPPHKRKGRRRTIAALAICALVSATPASARTLRVCADPNNLPFSNERGEGFENRIVALLGEELGASVEYTWWAQRRGFLRNTLKAGLCDLVPGLPKELEGVRTTAPYYRSTYVFVTRSDGPRVTSFDDPVLRDLTIGVQLVGDDGWNTPPAHALSRRGVIDNVRGYSLYGDYREPNPPARIIAAVAEREVDAAVAWGPLAGYFATRQKTPLQITPVQPQADAKLPMAWDIAMAVRPHDAALQQEIDAALGRRRADVDAILAGYGVPRVERALPRTDAAP